MIGSYRSDSDDNGVAEGDDYLPSDSDDDRISVDGGGQSDVCEKDSWRGRDAGGYTSEGVESGVAGGGSYRGRW